MEIEIAGHSGCTIEVKSDSGRLVLHKSTGDRSYVDRLLRQARKQESFSLHACKGFLVPEIYGISNTKDSCSVDMEFIYSQHFIEFFENAGFERLTHFIDLLLAFIEDELKRSPVTEVSGALLAHKFEDVRKVIAANAVVENDPELDQILGQVEGLFNRLQTLQLPIGICHGDLTLSNILFNGGSYYLIDMLDSFIETPLMDIVKLRQDTRYGWSFMMYRGNYDRTRNSITLSYMDQRIDEHFGRSASYRDYYGLFQIMNFLRILQYAKRTDIVLFIKRILRELILEYAT